MEWSVVDLSLVSTICSKGRDFSPGFKKVWERLSQNFSYWHKPCFFAQILNSKGGGGKQNKIWMIFCCVIRESAVYTFHSHCGDSEAVKELSFHFSLQVLSTPKGSSWEINTSALCAPRTPRLVWAPTTIPCRPETGLH